MSSNAIVNILPNMSIREAGDKWRSRGNLICMYVMGTGGCLHVYTLDYFNCCSCMIAIILFFVLCFFLQILSLLLLVVCTKAKSTVLAKFVVLKFRIKPRFRIDHDALCQPHMVLQHKKRTSPAMESNCSSAGTCSRRCPPPPTLPPLHPSLSHRMTKIATPDHLVLAYGVCVCVCVWVCVCEMCGD